MPESVRGRIDRYHKTLEREREREEVGKRPLVEETDVVEFFKRLGFSPTKYQEKLLRDKSKLILARWSRQSGKSLVMAVVVLFNALTKKGFRAASVAPGLRQSRKLIDKITGLVSILKMDVLEGEPQKGKLVFRNGSVIEALPNNPDTIRGETLNMVVADEFAYVEHDTDLYDAIIFTLSTTNGPFFATSTPGSRDTLFYGMATDDERFGDFSRHHVSYREALKPNGPIDPEFLERIRKQYQTDPGRWTREMEAEFADDEGVYLPRELIESCVTDNIDPFTSDEVVDGKLARTGKFFAGCDLGLSIDRSAVGVVQKRAPDIDLVHTTAFPQGTIFSHVTGYLNTLNQRLQTLSRIYIDETGLGGFFVQDAINAGLKNALGIYLSLPEKQEIMDILKRQMQDGHLHIPRDPELMNEMGNERVQLSKTGQLQFSHPAGTHDDRLWAVALAVYAARNEVPEYHPVMLLGRNPNYIGPRINLRKIASGAGPFNTPLLSNQAGSWYIHGGHVVPTR
ncbi:MAG TPA: terminase family protein [Candidatus Bathyarchaeia archaeon]|nr:terminase family protein [Candidatus Bathyarchaeia archaeon]